MLLGLGIGGISTFNGYYPFANIMWNADGWARYTGVGAWSQEWGTLSVASPTDQFYAKIAEGFGTSNLPSGTYTVLNPDGCEIGVGGIGSPSLTGWTTATQFTFTVPDTGRLSVYALWSRGGVTNVLGPIQVIMPGRLSAFQSGDIWNPAFITFLGGLGVKCLRFMDWFQAYYDVTEDWTDRQPDNPITLRAPQTLLRSKVPYGAAIALCNQLGIDLWINIPVRAADDFLLQLATMLKNNLAPQRYVYCEFGNETWNFGGPYSDARNWVAHFFNTRYEATPNFGINGWTRADHGLMNGERVAVFFSKENYQYDALMSWPLGFGNLLYVEVIDADNFVLRSNAPDGTVVPVPAGIQNLIYKKNVEAGKTVNVNTNHGIRSKQVWDIFEGVLGAGRVINVLGTQLANTGVTTERLAPAGVADACDAVAGASYYQGDWWVTCLDLASGQATPKVWSRNSGGSVRVAIYVNGSTPTMAEVIAGTGAGYIAHRDISGWALDAQAYTTGPAFTGLANGNGYECRAVLTGEGGYKWMMAGQFTASATASTVAFYDSDENMASRARRSTVEVEVPRAVAQKAVIGDIDLIEYESSSDYFGGNISLPEVVAWRTSYTQSQAAGDAFGHFYTAHSAVGLKLMNQFVDINAVPGVFNLAESFDDTSDYRYQKFVEFDGRIPDSVPLTISDATASPIATEPSYPSVVYSFADPSLTYRIFNGDFNGNLSIVGDQLRLVKGTGINWVVPASRTVTIEASNGSTTDYFNVTFATGNAWYEADALFAWDATTDSNNTAINPQRGNAVPLVTGSGASISSGLWDMDGNVYLQTSTALSADLNSTRPLLIAQVLDKDNHTTNFQNLLYIGGVWRVVFVLSGSGQPRFDYTGNPGVGVLCSQSAMTGGKKVYWTYFDPVAGQIRAGINQTENTTGGPVALTPFAPGNARDVIVGSQNTTPRSQMRHGSLQVVNRTGMTLADALAVVAKMQTLHSIA